MELLTTAEAAAYCRRAEDTILIAARRGELRSHQAVPRGKRTYRREWLDAWLSGGRNVRKLRAAS